MNNGGKNDKTLVLIPVYNEARTIANLVAEIRSRHPEFEVLVVDDGSRDGSGGKAERAGARLLRHAFNLGDGAARETGFIYALRHGYKYLVHLDGDRQHSPGEILSLLSVLQGGQADLVVGSRFRGRCTYKLSLGKQIGIKIFSLICSLAVRQKITDPTSGFRGLNRKAMQTLTTGYYPQHFPDADVIISAHFRGLKIVEIPVTMRDSHSQGLHRGGRAFYYVYKMLLSTFVSILGFPHERPARRIKPKSKNTGARSSPGVGERKPTVPG